MRKGSKIEKITVEELVERFGNKSQKNSFNEKGRLLYDVKRNILNNASKYCSVKELEDGTFKLTQKKQIAVMPDFIQTASGLYPYTCPLLLNYITHQPNKVILGTLSLAQNIDMVNDYFAPMNRNPNLTAKELRLDTSNVYDCLNHIEDTVNYYIEQSLRYLKQMQLIAYDTKYLVVNGGINLNRYNINIRQNTSLATTEEMDIIKVASAQADAYADTKNASERYYSMKATKWSKKFHDILDEYGIINVFSVYEIWDLNKQKSADYISQFADSRTLVLSLNNALKTKICDNALKRLNNNIFNKDSGEIEEFMIAYKLLTKICIGSSKINKRIISKMDKIKQIEAAKKTRNF